MRYNDIGEDGILSIADELQHNNTLKILNVSGCECSVKGIASTYVACYNQLVWYVHCIFTEMSCQFDSFATCSCYLY